MRAKIARLFLKGTTKTCLRSGKATPVPNRIQCWEGKTGGKNLRSEARRALRIQDGSGERNTGGFCGATLLALEFANRIEPGFDVTPPAAFRFVAERATNLALSEVAVHGENFQNFRRERLQPCTSA
jgi:hypothetical protein